MFAGILIASSHLSNAGLITTTDQVTVAGIQCAKTSIFSGLGWDLINAQCPGGKCTATSVLNGFDMDGWIWATFEEVANALNTFTAANNIRLNDGVDTFEYDSAWAPAILSSFGGHEDGDD